tara:strand:- start:296 stop:2251 length:1956 start_codon:yes stop_codon:yes gene_type:complete
MANGEGQLTQQQIAEAEAERDRLRLENMSALGATFNSLGQGLTFGFSDELAAGIASTFMAPFSDENFDEIYERQVEQERGLIKAGQEKYPWLSVGAEIAGGIPTGLGFYKAGTAILKNAPRLARLMGIGAVEGGIYGAGVAEEGGTEEGAIRGAGFGAALGPVGAGVAHVGGRAIDRFIKPLFRRFTETPKGEARRIFQKALDRDDMTPAQVQRELDELGPDAVIADIRGNVQGLARTVAQEPGKPRVIGERLLHNRQRSQQQRVLESAGVDPNDVGTFRMNVTQLINNRRTQAATHYQEAYETVLDPTNIRTIVVRGSDGSEQEIKTSLNELLEVIPKSFINKAKNLMRGDTDLLESIRRKFPDTAEGRADAMKQFQNPDTNSFQFYDYLKRALDERIGLKIRHGAAEEVRNLMGQKNRLLSYLDEASPAYREARETYAGEANLRSAVEYGRSLMNNKVDLAEAQLAFEAMSAGERKFLRQGIIRGLVDRLENTKEMSNFASSLVDTKRMRELLGYAFPDQDSFNRFMTNMIAENRYSYSRNYILGGSQTAPRLAGQADLNKEIAIGEALRSGEPITIGIAAIRELVGSDVSPGTLEALGHILFNREIPKSVTETVARRARGLGPASGIVSASVLGERVREDVGGDSSVQ